MTKEVSNRDFAKIVYLWDFVLLNYGDPETRDFRGKEGERRHKYQHLKQENSGARKESPPEPRAQETEKV